MIYTVNYFLFSFLNESFLLLELSFSSCESRSQSSNQKANSLGHIACPSSLGCSAVNVVMLMPKSLTIIFLSSLAPVFSEAAAPQNSTNLPDGFYRPLLNEEEFYPPENGFSALDVDDSEYGSKSIFSLRSRWHRNLQTTDSSTTTRVNIFQRLTESLGLAVVGSLFIILVPCLIWTNEGGHVRESTSINFCKNKAIAV